MAEEESQHEDQSPPVVERRDPTSQPVAPGDGQAPSLWLWRGQAGTSHSCLPSLPLRKPRTRGLSVYSLFGQKMGYVMPDVCETGSGPELRHTLQSQSPSQALLPLPFTPPPHPYISHYGRVAPLWLWLYFIDRLCLRSFNFFSESRGG